MHNLEPCLFFVFVFSARHIAAEVALCVCASFDDGGIEKGGYNFVSTLSILQFHDREVSLWYSESGFTCRLERERS